MDGAVFSSCTSPHTIAPALGDGPHTFAVQATDAAGNEEEEPVVVDFTVDTVAPDTTITSGPTHGGGTDDPTPTFAFQSSEPVGATFRCWVDNAVPAPCNSPHTTGTLSDGVHTFRVRAIDAAGNQDATVAVRTFTVDTTPPALAINNVSVAEPVSLAQPTPTTKTATFTVSLSSPVPYVVSVGFATSNGTATPGGAHPDYNANSGQLMFAANQTTRTVAVTVRGDLHAGATNNEAPE